MYSRRVIAGLLLIAVPVLPLTAFSAAKEQPKEDTAHISLQKTAVAKRATKTYQVKKGDSILKILQGLPVPVGHRYTLMKELNPSLKDVNAIYPGQVLILPAGDVVSEQKGETATYVTQKGDSIARIIIRKFHADAVGVLKITKQIKELNPKITNLNRIYPGQILILPEKAADVEEGEPATASAESPAPEATEAATSAEAAPEPEGDAQSEKKPSAAQEKRLAVISHVIKRMGGNVISAGNYFIPLPDAGRVALDCTTVPVAELGDGSTILIDLTGRLPDSLKGVIQMNWKNYALVRLSPQEDTAAALRKIVGASREYTMAKWGKPLTVGTSSRIQIVPDWIITRKTPAGGSPYRQGLFFLGNAAQSLPRPIVSFAEKNGLAVTQIIAGTGVADSPETGGALREIPVITGATALDTASNLVALFGYQGIRDAEVNIFETAKDGFNLTIKAGLLVKTSDRQVLFHPKKLPQQFLDILKEAKTDVVVIADNEEARSVVEKALRGINVPFTQNTFSFSLAGGKGDKAQTTLSLPAIKAEKSRDASLYLVNFAVDRDIGELLHTRWGVDLVRY